MKTGLRNIPDGCFEKLSDEKLRDLLGNKQWLIQKSDRKNEYTLTYNTRGQFKHIIIKQNMMGQWGVEGKGETHPNINKFLESINRQYGSQILPTEA